MLLGFEGSEVDRGESPAFTAVLCRFWQPDIVNTAAKYSGSTKEGP